jgi:hypothetical protein
MEYRINMETHLDTAYDGAAGTLLQMESFTMRKLKSSLLS